MDKITKASAEMTKLLHEALACYVATWRQQGVREGEGARIDAIAVQEYVRTLQQEHAAMKEALENARYQMDFGNESGDREEGKGNAKAYEIITKVLSSLTL